MKKTDINAEPIKITKARVNDVLRKAKIGNEKEKELKCGCCNRIS